MTQDLNVNFRLNMMVKTLLNVQNLEDTILNGAMMLEGIITGTIVPIVLKVFELW